MFQLSGKTNWAVTELVSGSPSARGFGGLWQLKESSSTQFAHSFSGLYPFLRVQIFLKLSTPSLLGSQLNTYMSKQTKENCIPCICMCVCPFLRLADIFSCSPLFGCCFLLPRPVGWEPERQDGAGQPSPVGAACPSNYPSATAESLGISCASVVRSNYQIEYAVHKSQLGFFLDERGNKNAGIYRKIFITSWDIRASCGLRLCLA